MGSSDKVKTMNTVRTEALQSGAYPFVDEANTDPMSVASGEFDDAEPTRTEQPRFASGDETLAEGVGEESSDDGEPTRAG